MKKPVKETCYFFVDEAGDPIFYNKYGVNIVGQEGCSVVLILGFIRTTNPESLRKAVLALRDEISKDKYLEKIPSLVKTLRAFHAKDDCPEVREKFYKLIIGLDFKAEFIVARKREDIFIKRHKKSENKFYDDLFSKLFENKLHVNEKTIIYYAVRGNKDRQIPIDEAINNAKENFEKKWKVRVDSEIMIQPQSPMGEVCLQIIDYMNWAIQRAFSKGEDRYYKFVEEKVSYLVDIYDTKKYPKNYYTRKNKFDLTKISPL